MTRSLLSCFKTCGLWQPSAITPTLDPFDRILGETRLIKEVPAPLNQGSLPKPL